MPQRKGQSTLFLDMGLSNLIGFLDTEGVQSFNEMFIMK